MSWTFPIYSNNWLDAADFLDSQSMISIFLKLRLDTISAGSRQYIFSHRGSTGQISLRKNNAATEYLRFSVTDSSGVNKYIDSTFAPSAATAYLIGLTWQKNSAGGIKLYSAGALDVSDDTTTQTVDYGTEGGQDLHFSNRVLDSNPGQCSVEDFMVWTGKILTAGQFKALGRGTPWWLAGTGRPQLWYPFNGNILTAVLDKSGRGRSLDNIDTSPAPTNGGILGPRPRAMLTGLARYKTTSSTGSPPNPWTRYSEVFHPLAAELVTGLTNGTAYEFSVIAVDQSGNEAERSAIVEVTPNTPALPTLSYRVPWKRPRRISKYRSAQQ